ncbi:hypothetical protein [Burkholderia glumae]
MKKKLEHFKNIAARSIVVGAAGATIDAHAAGTDFSTLTSGIDFSTVTTGILAVAATLITVYVAIKGAKILIGMVRGA